MLSRVNLRVISMKDVAGQVLSEIKAADKAGLTIIDLLERLDIGLEQITLALKALMSEGIIMQKQEIENER